MLVASTGMLVGLATVLVAGPASAAPVQHEGARAAQVRVLEQEIYLGEEIDRCSGQLSVINKYGQPVDIQRGVWTPVDVAIDGGSYWHWKCGGSGERSRGSFENMQRVKRL